MKETLRYALILGIICFLASGVLAVVNALTEPQIQLQKEDQERAALEEVMPEAAAFEAEAREGKDYYLALDNNNQLIGFVIKSEQRGYSSDIEVLTGLNLNLGITNIKILSQNETPGLGSKVIEPSFQDQFKGKDLNSIQEVDTITGATISSTAVINSIKDRISELKQTLLFQIENAR